MIKHARAIACAFVIATLAIAPAPRIGGANAAAAAQGGSTQAPAAGGCLKQWMSNNIWRMRVTAIGPDMGNGAQIGWTVTQDWTKIISRPAAPSDTNITDQQLVLAGGKTASSHSAGSSASFNQLAHHTFPPGSTFTYEQHFRPANFKASDKPIALFVTFNATAQNASAGGPHYNNPANFHISFECSK